MTPDGHILKLIVDLLATIESLRAEVRDLHVQLQGEAPDADRS